MTLTASTFKGGTSTDRRLQEGRGKGQVERWARVISRNKAIKNVGLWLGTITGV